MSQDHKSIADKIDRGDYFKDGLKWYSVKYLSPYNGRSYLLLFAIITILSAWLSTSALFDNSEDSKYYFPVFAPDQSKYYSKISNLEKTNESISDSVATYIVSKYVTFRESYDKDILDDNNFLNHVNRVKKLSSRRVYDEYEKYINMRTNSNSPVLKFKDELQREVSIQGIVIKKLGHSYEASIKYKALVSNGRDKGVVTNHKVKLEFVMSDLDNVIKDKVNLQFLVTKYKGEGIA